MKMKNLFLLPALIAALNLLPAGQGTAQTFTTLHSFTAYPDITNPDGANPQAGLITNSSGNILYGTAASVALARVEGRARHSVRADEMSNFERRAEDCPPYLENKNP